MKRTAFVLLAVAIFAGCSTSSADSGADSGAGALSNSSERYEKLMNRMSAPGCYEFAGFVFCIVVQNVPRSKLQAAKAKDPHLAVALLRKRYSSLPQEFTLKSHVVENCYDDVGQIHRYVIAYRLAEIKDLLR